MAEAISPGDQSAFIAETAKGLVEETKGRDMVDIDTRARTNNIFDRLLICTATSNRHAAAIAENLRVGLKRAGVPIFGIEGPGEMGWTLIDTGPVVVHIFLKEAREHYDLESLWALPEEERVRDPTQSV